jgi:hypothetical protein
MQSIPRALIRELLDHGRWGLLAAFLGANALPLLLMSALFHDGAIDAADPALVLIHFVLLQISALVFGAAVYGAQGHLWRLYAWPVTTPTLVFWRMLPAMLLVAAQSVFTAALINHLFHAAWPLWGPALFLAAAVAAVQAVVWSTEKTEWLIPALIAVSTVLGLWFKSRYGAMFSQISHYWQTVTLAEVVTMLAVIALSYNIAVRGVARQRRGDTLPSLEIRARLERLLDPAPAVGRPFRTPAEAQFWFEWRKKGWIMPATVLFGLTIGTLWWLITNRNAEDLYLAFIAGGGLLSIAGMLGGVILGNVGPNDANQEMSQFQAVRPLTSTDMARILLRVVARSTLLAWGLWAAPFALLILILWLTDSLARPLVPEGVGWWYLPVTLLGPWVIATLGTSVGLTGWLSTRSKTVMLAISGFVVLIIGLPILARFVLAESVREQFARAAVIVFGIVCVLGTAWAFRAARRRSFIESPTVLACVSLFVTLAAAVLMAHWFRPGNSLHFTAFCIGIAALAVAAPATAPLALAWNRNR